MLQLQLFKKSILEHVGKSILQPPELIEQYPFPDQVIYLGFLVYDFFKQNTHYEFRHLVLDETSYGPQFRHFQFNFFELPKFNKNLDQLTNVKDKWLYFMKHTNNISTIPDQFPDQLKEPKKLREAFDLAQPYTWTGIEQHEYDNKGVFIADCAQSIERNLQ
jgi:hypothetical protein